MNDFRMFLSAYRLLRLRNPRGQSLRLAFDMVYGPVPF
jgi:hypothetical protein